MSAKNEKDKENTILVDLDQRDYRNFCRIAQFQGFEPEVLARHLVLQHIRRTVALSKGR